MFDFGLYTQVSDSGPWALLFEMLIVPHALHCIDGCFFVFNLIWQSGILFWFQHNTPAPEKKIKENAPFSTTPTNPPHPPLPQPHPPSSPTRPLPKKIFFSRFEFFGLNSLTRELKIRVVGFVLKMLSTFFEKLIVPHALHCKDGFFFVFYLIWQAGRLFWFQNPPYPPPPTPTPPAPLKKNNDLTLFKLKN